MILNWTTFFCVLCWLCRSSVVVEINLWHWCVVLMTSYSVSVSVLVSLEANSIGYASWYHSNRKSGPNKQQHTQNYTKRKIYRAWISRLLRYPAGKWNESLLSTRSPHRTHRKLKVCDVECRHKNDNSQVYSDAVVKKVLVKRIVFRCHSKTCNDGDDVTRAGNPFQNPAAAMGKNDCQKCRVVLAKKCPGVVWHTFTEHDNFSIIIQVLPDWPRGLIMRDFYKPKAIPDNYINNEGNG